MSTAGAPVVATQSKMIIGLTTLAYRSETLYEFVPVAGLADTVALATVALSTTVDSSVPNVAMTMAAQHWVVMAAGTSPNGTPQTRISICNRSRVSLTTRSAMDDDEDASPDLLHRMADLVQHHVGGTARMALQHVELVLLSELVADDARDAAALRETTHPRGQSDASPVQPDL